MRGHSVIVTISGKPGSGKSTVARTLAADLGMEHVSAGDFMREMATERGITVLTLSAIAETDGGAIDREIDQRTRRFSEQADDFVIDARLAWHFIDRSVKVFLDVSLEVAAARIFGDRRGSEAENVDLIATRAAVQSRLDSETLRYREYYNLDWLDLRHFDLVVDTSSLSIAEVVAEVSAYLEALRP
jgi:cytidylate kinase